MRAFAGVLRSLVLAALAVSVGVVAARADGKVFAPVMVPQQVEMPDQRALLAWKDGVETLVIESAFVGKGTDFAWVVPLPDKPEVFAATRGTLPSAVALMQPVVAEPLPGELLGIAFLAGVVGLVALGFGWRGVDGLFRATVLGLIGSLLGGGIDAFFWGEIGWTWLIFALGAIFLGRNFVRRPSQLQEVLITLLVGLVLAAIAIPTMGKVRSFGAEAQQTVVNITVERSVVGDFDVAVIAGREGAGVVGWLELNGFALDAAARTVATEHATGGGWFVASRVRREFTESGRSVPAPLAFRFKTERALYPMRLTGAGATRELQVELVVFGPSRAEATGLTARAVAPLRFGEVGEPGGRMGNRQPVEARNVSHPELVRWAEGTASATWLRGTLAPSQMKEDVMVQWGAGAGPVGLYALAEGDAWARALALGGLVCFAGALGCGLAFPAGRPPTKWAVVVLAVSVAAVGSLRAITPTVAVTHAKGGIRWYEFRQVSIVAALTIMDLPPGTGDAEVRAAFARDLEKHSKENGWRVRIGNAPGEVELQKLPSGKWRVLFYDAYGQAAAMKGDEVEVGDGRK